MTKEERASIKSRFPRDKRGQGLGYRLTDVRNEVKVIKMNDTLECETKPTGNNQRQCGSKYPKIGIKNEIIDDLPGLKEGGENINKERNDTDREIEVNCIDVKNNSLI